MNKISKTAIGAVILSAIALVGTFAFHPTKTVVQVPTHQVGAGTPDFSSSYFLNVNGVKEYYASEAMKTGTTTVCSFPNPAVAYDGASSTAQLATTTLQYITAHFTSPISSAEIYEIATSTSAQGTTSDLVSATTIGANATSTSGGWLASNWFSAQFPSNMYANVVVSSSTGTISSTTVQYSGMCYAEWTSY